MIHKKDVYAESTMAGGQTRMQRRINISLPERTVRLLDRVAKKGDRSRLIDAAVKSYIGQIGRAKLRKEMAAGYRQKAQEDLEIATDWFAV